MCWFVWLAALTVGMVEAVNTSISTVICESPSFQQQTAVPLGSSPLSLKSLVQGEEICIEVAFTATVDTAPTWFAIGLSRTDGMVSDPHANVLLYELAKGMPEAYTIAGYSSSTVTKASDQGVLKVVRVEGLSFRYQRKLAAMSEAEVAIDVSTPSTLIWAYGSSWPIGSHATGTRGVAKFDFASGSTSDASLLKCNTYNCTGIIGAMAFGLMLLAGLVVRFALRSTSFGHFLLHHTIGKPPVKATTNAPLASPCVMVSQNVADLRVGEAVVALIFVGAMVIVAIVHADAGSTVATGKMGLLVLMFLILPVSRIPLWSILFGSSFERIIKFHRWLGMALTLTGLVHAICASNLVSPFESANYGNVTPLYGAIAFVAMLIMGFCAGEVVRRKAFEVFYYSHRVLSIVAFVAIVLHAPARIGLPLIVPLSFYVVGLVMRWWTSFSISHRANLTTGEAAGITTVYLNPTEETKVIAKSMNECSYFWVQVPALSMWQWHPFSAIVSPDGQSIGFVVKSMAPTGFTGRLHLLAKKENEIKVRLCGPFGKLSMDLNAYNSAILVAGGVGITPMVSLINQRRMLQQNNGSKTPQWHVVWSVRDAKDLLMADAVMPSQVDAASVSPTSLHIQNPNPPMSVVEAPVEWHCFVSKASADGTVSRRNGDQVSYRRGRPALSEYINRNRYTGRRVAVLACGPPTLLAEAQALARECNFDFHKEVFAW